jgi:hypothetical protein
VLAVAEAVAYAHSQRVIHRDLKPANVLLGNFGEVVVIDWGLAKHLDAAEPQNTKTTVPSVDATGVGVIVGTPVYMPPEQAMGRSVDERADVYSIGAMLYEVLTGEPPFSGDTVEEVLQSLLTKRPVAVEKRAPDAHPDLVAIVHNAMAAHPSARYANAAELAADLRRFQLGHVLVHPREDASFDPKIERAFQAELQEKCVRSVRATSVIAFVLIAAYAVVPRLYLGRFSSSDLVPRGIALSLIVAIFFSCRHAGARKWSEALSVAIILIVGMLIILVNVLTDGKMTLGFNGSMALLYLGCALLLPLTIRALAITIPLLSALAMKLVPIGSTEELVTQAWLFAACGLLAYVGTRSAMRVRRIEFYNRYRLQAANERLAKLEGRGPV